jgi:F0F1-type ATP synthase assembly protein I
VSKEERDERRELEEELDEDLELNDESADKVKGGKAKTADKAFKAMSDYIRG